jgi:hypothetical protein
MHSDDVSNRLTGTLVSVRETGRERERERRAVTRTLAQVRLADAKDELATVPTRGGRERVECLLLEGVVLLGGLLGLLGELLEDGVKVAALLLGLFHLLGQLVEGEVLVVFVVIIARSTASWRLPVAFDVLLLHLLTLLTLQRVSGAPNSHAHQRTHRGERTSGLTRKMAAWC